jgi:hypothetical protein
VRLYLVLSAFTVWMAVEAVRRGQTQSWLWIILFFGPLGAAAYFFTQYLDLAAVGFGGGARRVTRGDIREAQADVRRLDSAAAFIHLASLHRARKEFDGAGAAARKAVERAPANIDAQHELGLALLGAGRHAEAVEPLEKVVAKDRAFDTGNALYALAQAQRGAGDLTAARATLEELEGQSSRPEILYDRAILEGRLGNREAAARCLQRIIDEAEYVPDYLQRTLRPWVKKARQGLKKLGQAGS